MDCLALKDYSEELDPLQGQEDLLRLQNCGSSFQQRCPGLGTRFC